MGNNNNVWQTIAQYKDEIKTEVTEGTILKARTDNLSSEDIQKIKRAISSIGYNTHFMDIKEIKEIAVKETLIIEKQKKQDFSEFALVIIKNIEK